MTMPTKTKPYSLALLNRCGALVDKTPNQRGHAVRHALNTLASPTVDRDAAAIRIYEKIITLEPIDREVVLAAVEELVEPTPP